MIYFPTSQTGVCALAFLTLPTPIIPISVDVRQTDPAADKSAHRREQAAAASAEDHANGRPGSRGGKNERRPMIPKRG
jgi:hypothetical protein